MLFNRFHPIKYLFRLMALPGARLPRVCQGKVEPGFPEKTNENKRIWSLSGSI
jgi:hypothetical protein